MNKENQELRIAEARTISRTLIDLGDQAKENFAQAVEKLGISVPLARALLVLVEPRLGKDIAVELGCDPSYVTGIARQLEEKKLLVRVSGKDRRQKFMKLTPQGEKMRARVAQAVDGHGLHVERLTSDELTSLINILEKLR